MKLIPALSVALSLCAGAIVAAVGQPLSQRQLNFIIFIADDLGTGDLGCYGNNVIQTPNLDQLASEGMRFSNAFLTISSCSPSRSSILTGRYPHNTGAEDLHQPLPEDQKTIAQLLRKGGYYCAAVGKWHLGNAEKANWDSVVEAPGEMAAKCAIETIRNRDKAKPFFFWIASMDPHRPYLEGAIPTPHNPQQVIVPPYLPDHPNIRKELALYYDEIARFDSEIGKIRDTLAGERLLDNTIIVFLSDNGMPFPRAKTTLYDSGICTPLIFWWPGVIQPKTVQNGLVSAIDIAPTILAIACVHQDTMQGKNILPMLKNPDATVRDAVFAEANWHDFEHFTRAVRTQRYKLIRHYYWDTPLWNSVDSINSITWQAMLELKQAGKLTKAQAMLFEPQRPFEEFYDLEADPNELNNIIDQQQRQHELFRLRTLLDNWRVDTQDRMPAERRLDGWTRDGKPLPHNQPWYDRYIEQGQKSSFDRF